MRVRSLLPRLLASKHANAPDRAARIAGSLPCLVPSGWVSLPEEPIGDETIAGKPFEPPRADDRMNAISAGVSITAP